MINPNDLRSASFPTAKSGYEPEKVDAVIEMCAKTIESLEEQIGDLQRSVALARAEAAPMEVGSNADEEDAIAQWLTTLDPLDISQEVQKNIAEALVESTMAASHIRKEAKERVKALIDAVADEVQKLITIVKQAKVSLEAAAHLPENLAAWEGSFSGRITLLLEELQLPWTVQVSQLAKVLAHMAENKSEEPAEISRRNHRKRIDPSNPSVTTTGEWA